jgi:hypothetical protein
MVNEFVDEYTAANYDEDWEEYPSLGHNIHCPYEISTIDKCRNSEIVTLINSPSVKPDMKSNVRSYGNQSE